MRGKRIRNLSVLLMTLAILLGFFNKVSAAEEEKLKLKVNVGFDSVYKLGTTVPVNIQIDNNLKNINGEIQIEVNSNPNTELNNVTIYAQNISLPNNSSKSLILNVPIIRYVTKLKVNIIEGKNTVYAKEITIPGGLNSDSMLIGILSDDYDSVSYINDVKASFNRTYNIKNAKLDEKNLPDSDEALKGFNVIVINNFDTSKLSEMQYTALKKWVMNGGLLFVGTGSTNNKTLAVFRKDSFIEGEVGNISDITTNKLYEINGDAGTNATLKLPSLFMNIKDSVQTVKEGAFPLLHRIEKGKGVVAIAAFDLGTNPVASWSQKGPFMAKLIGTVLPSYYASPMFQKGAPMDRDIYMINQAVRNIPELPVPKSKNLGILFLIYIIVTAPVNYFILKKLDKRELMWVTVPILSIIFGAVMYVLGFSTRITQPVANVVSFINMDGKGTINPSIYAGIFTPTKTDIKVEAGEGMRIKAMPSIGYDYGMAVMPGEKAPKIIDAKVYLGSKGTVEFYGNTIFSNKPVAIENDEVLSGKLQCSLNFSAGSFTGELNNLSGFDFDEAYIITPDNYITLGAVKNGEKRSISETGTTYTGNLYDFTNKIYKNPFMGPNPPTSFTDQELMQIRKDQQKRDIINIFLQGDYSKVSEPRVIAFSSRPLSKDIIVNGKTVKKYEKELIGAPVTLTFKKDNTVEYPLGYIKPTVENSSNMKGGYDEMGGMMFGNGSFEFKFSIDKSIKVEKIQGYFTYQGASGSGDVKQYVWNNAEGKYDELSIHNLTLEGNTLAKYLDKDNTLKLKIEVINQGMNAQIPRISVKGSVK